MRNARELFARNSNSTTFFFVFFLSLGSFVRSEARARRVKEEEEEKKNERPLSNANELCVVVCAFPKRREFEGGGRWELGALRRSGHE